MLDLLPGKVTVEILIRLPAKLVLRCKCVCKRWNSLISNPLFATVYLARSKQHPYHLFRLYQERTQIELFTLHRSDDLFHRDKDYYDKMPNFRNPAIRINLRGSFDFSSDIIKLDFPHKTKYCFHTIVGSVNGLICLVDCRSSVNGSCYLWNPSINRSIQLPHPKFHYNLTSYSHGFGYHAPTNDYKLVRIVYLKNNFNSPVVEIYTLNTGVWRSFTAPPSAQFIIDSSVSVVVNEALHWLAHTPQNAHHNLIVSFDLGNEVVFNEVPVPKILESVPPLPMMNIAVLNGLLALHGGQPKQVGRGRDRWVVKDHVVWVMKEYGVVESWTKLYVIDVGERFIRVVGFKKNGEVLLARHGLHHKALVLYEPDSRRSWDLQIHGLSSSFYLDNYVESLVLSNAGKIEANVEDHFVTLSSFE